MSLTLPWATARAASPAMPTFLDDVFAPVASETETTALRVEGALPPDLSGLYARIGPNPLKPQPSRYHWFIGDGMVHGLRLHAGQAQWYRSRYIGSNSVHKALGRPVLPGPRHGVGDVVNTNVYAHAGRVWASVEAGMLPVQLDARLASVRHGTFDSPHKQPFSAHPHRDPHTGALHAICYNALVRHKVQYVRVSPQGQVDRVVDIPVQHGPMIHDCAITRRYVVVLDLPVTFSFRRLLGRAPFPYAWNPRHPARVGLLPKEGDARDIRWFDVDPCFVFHPCNAFEREDGSVVLDVVAHRRMFDRARHGPELDSGARFERWVLPADGGRVVRTVLHDAPQEFPRLDERLTGEPYRYAYAVGFQPDQPGGQPLYRHDLQMSSTVVHGFGPHAVPGEFVFVPRQPTGAEDDGWLVGLVHNRQSGCAEFHVLNADDFTGPPQAVVHIPVRIPAGFHGNWMAEADLQA
ncbi:carotenoid oxygenase [Aquabacterium fontiphilum]|uniref:carotenoid oxygenase family protein n=1 Tax=Aquabacterium fontiphilum TaxID=450365 RepID=UPI001378EF0B|nr:carotenoid oxygenase family protein [Aquabacterium fontiphilum]NBD20411.1 carotenoid oxygenase [Aquabacterium fontiphilum]